MTTSTAQKSFIKRHSDSISAFVAALLVTAGVVGVAYQIQQRYTLATFATLADRQAESLKANVENDLKFIGGGGQFLSFYRQFLLVSISRLCRAGYQ